MAERIIDINLVDQYTEDSINYMLYVSRYRVLPSPFDALKPVQRKLIYGTYNDVKAIKSTVKSAAILGTIMDKYHPHGDSGIYGAIKTMTNWFEIYCPLFTKQGSFGTFQGDPASAPRYTEARLSDFALECVISDLQYSKNSVDWIDTYDNRFKEPEFLPVAVPLLLINGSFGIGVGLKVEIPSHNINDVIDATVKLIKDPNCKDIILIPDHCMDCEIIDNNTNWKAITNTGTGHYTVRGKIEITEYQGKPALAIKSLPNMTFFNSIKEKIETMVSENKLIQVYDIIEKSNKDALNTLIVLKKGSDPNYVKDVIYKNTDMMKKCRINLEVLMEKTVHRLSYIEYLKYFIEFRRLTKYRLYYNILQDVLTKMHEKELYIRVLESGYIDTILNMIRKRNTTDDTELVNFMIENLKVTDLQAKYVLNNSIKRLAIGYLPKYKEEYNIHYQESLRLRDILTNDQFIDEEIISDLLTYKKKYGGPRRCKIIKNAEVLEIPQGQFKIVITENNFIKKVQVNDSLGYFKGDAPKIVVVAENTENLIIFDDMGKVFKLPVHKIDFSDKNSNGIDIRLLIKNLTSNINTVIYEPILKTFANKVNKFFLTTITQNGYIKKLDLEDLLAITPSGILYTKLDTDDRVKDILIVNESSDIIIYSANKALRINLSEVPHLKRNTKGNKAMNTDYPIEGLSIIKHDTTDIVVVTQSGRVNRLPVIALPLSNRAKAGSSVLKLGKSDSIKSIYGLNYEDSIRIVTKNNKQVIPVTDIPEASSISTGTKLIPLKDDIIIRCEIIRNKK